MRLILFFVLAILSSASFAETYYWSSADSQKHPSASAACAAGVAFLGGPGVKFVRFESPIFAWCEGNNYAGQQYGPAFWMSRYGDGCPDGSTLDSATGGCSTPAPDKGTVCDAGGGTQGLDKITDSSGQCVSLEDADTPATCKYLSGKTRTTQIFVTFDDDGNPNEVPVNKMGCVANPISLAKCKMPVAKEVNGISIQHGGKNCMVDVTFTGEQFEEGKTTPYPLGSPQEGKEGICPDDAQCTVPDAPVVVDSKPCNYMSNGQVVGCETTQFQGNPGEMNCGTVNNGPYTCTTRPPTSTGSSVKTEIKTTPNSDGGTTVTKDDVHTEVKCTAPGSCTTTVTKTTNVTIKDGAGNTTASNTTCTGSKCASSTNPDADGDGLGDCVKNCSEEEEGGEFVAPTIGETKTVGESTQAFVNAVKGGPLMSAVSNIRVPTGGTCHFGSADIGFTTINFDSMCDLWSSVSSVLSAIFLAIWALIAVRIVMSA